MPSPPRTREFYRPILEDLHEATRQWRESLFRIHVRQLLFVVAMLLGGPLLIVGLYWYSAWLGVARQEREIEFRAAPAAATEVDAIPVTVKPESDLVRSLEERGARFGQAAHGLPTTVTLAGEEFTDQDMQALSTIQTLESVTVIDADVTDDGLRALRLPQLRHLRLVNTNVTEAAAAEFPQRVGPANVQIQLIREFGEE